MTYGKHPCCCPLTSILAKRGDKGNSAIDRPRSDICPSFCSSLRADELAAAAAPLIDLLEARGLTDGSSS